MSLPNRLSAALSLLLSLSAITCAHAATGPFGGVGFVAVPMGADGHAGERPRPVASGSISRATSPTASDRVAFLPLDWPLERSLGNGVMIVNHTDLDTTAGQRDFMGGTWNYDGHSGTDIQLTDFRSMDRGVRVLASAAGTVVYMDDTSPYDRHCDFDWPDGGNWVWLQATDGSYHEYYHLRRSSIVVKLGEGVQRGQLIGLVGSSGYSTGPHLHFETGDDTGPGGAYRFRDPFHGTAQPLPTLWAAQPSYGASGGISFFGSGVFTEAQTRGSVFNTNYCDMMNTIPQPVVLGRDQEKLCMWFQFQSPAGDSAIIRVRRPDGSVYGEFQFVSSAQDRYGWFWSWFYLSPYTTAADHGLWRLQVLVHGQLHRDTPFTVGATSVYGPRFAPRGGRSFRINGATQRDTLRRSPFGGPVTYALRNAPAAVTLVADSIVTIAATSAQPTRSHFFQVVMTDAASRRDTAWYHLVDLSKPTDPLTLDAGDPHATPGLALAITPQPMRESTRIGYVLPRAGHVALSIHDLAGRRVALLADGAEPAGPHEVTWNGRDDHGGRSRAGVYFARIVSVDGVCQTKVVLLN